jgi:uncharacterized LabA/DUF88 family protein
MDRVAILIDAGNLTAAGGGLTLGTTKRMEMDVKVGSLLEKLRELVKEHSHLPILRTYWYDAQPASGLTTEQKHVRDCDYTKLRLGRIVYGNQKGVDALIYRDITTLARERSVVRAYLLASDEDLREGVAEAQSLGIQVVLIAVEPSGNSKISDELLYEVDEVIDLDEDFLKEFFVRRA